MAQVKAPVRSLDVAHLDTVRLRSRWCLRPWSSLCFSRFSREKEEAGSLGVHGVHILGACLLLAVASCPVPPVEPTILSVSMGQFHET